MLELVYQGAATGHAPILYVLGHGSSCTGII